MLGPITIQAPRDPAEVKARIMEHIAAIDALLNGMTWDNNEANDCAQDAGVHLTDAANYVELAFEREETYVAPRAEEDAITARNRRFMASEQYP